MKRISRVNYKSSDLLYEFPAETRLTVYRRLDIKLFVIFEIFSRNNAFVHYAEVCVFFQTKFIENHAWKCNQLLICSMKLKVNVTGSFS